jgi:hypothetical protein
MESHLLKLIANKEYICEVLEEIIEYNVESDKLCSVLIIVE